MSDPSKIKLITPGMRFKRHIYRRLAKMQDKLHNAKIIAGILDQQVYTGPWSVQIDLTNNCNNDCLGCWCRSPLLGEKAMTAKDRNKMIPTDVAKDMISDLAKLGVRDIYFTGGGEPFMHPDIIEIIRLVKKNNIHCDMSTNFTLVDEDKAKDLVKIGMDHMNVSVWAGSAETYAKLHPNKSEDTFYQIRDILKFIFGLKMRNRVDFPKYGIYEVVSKVNYSEIHDMLRFAYDVRADSIDFTPIDIIPGKTEVLTLNDKHRAIALEQLRSLHDLRDNLARQYGYSLNIWNHEQFVRRLSNESCQGGTYDKDIIDRIPCFAGWTFARVLAGGDFNACLKSFRIPFGNINNTRFKDIWFSRNQEDFRCKSLNLKKDDPYFKIMGNDTEGEQGCYTCCDNLGLNLLYNGRIESMNWLKKKLVKLSRFL